MQYSEQVTRKFTNINALNGWSILTDTGWEVLEDIKQTVEYSVCHLELADGKTLDCADDHIVFDVEYNEIFVKQLIPGQTIITADGPVAVKSVHDTQVCEPMYDCGVASINHRFYTNDILSHNTTTAAGYLLWYAMFVPNSTILVAAHKSTGALEVMSRIRFAYESCPDYIRCGVTGYNKGSIDFENGSRIIAQTTNPTTGRGLSISLLYCLEGDSSVVRIRDKDTLVEEDITLTELYARLYNPTAVLDI